MKQPVFWFAVVVAVALAFITYVTIAYGATATYSYVVGDNANWTADTGGRIWGQTFTTNTVDLALDSVQIYALRTGSPGTCNVSIKAVDGSHLPTGSDLSTGSFNASSIGTTVSWVSIALSDYEFSASTEYALLVNCPSVAGGNLFTWRGDTSGEFADGGTVYTASGGGAFTFDAGQDMMFQVWTDPVATPTPLPSGAVVYTTSGAATAILYVMTWFGATLLLFFVFFGFIFYFKK